jgi:hypothetical protein
VLEGAEEVGHSLQRHAMRADWKAMRRSLENMHAPVV